MKTTFIAPNGIEDDEDNYEEFKEPQVEIISEYALFTYFK